VCCNHNGRTDLDNYYCLYPHESVVLKLVHLSGDQSVRLTLSNNQSPFTQQSRRCMVYYLYRFSSVL
jgi:hypothetical protein